MATLHNQLLQVKAADFDAPDDLLSPAPRQRQTKVRVVASGASLKHKMLQSDDWYGPAHKQRRRQRACKVCALFRGEDPKSHQTTFYCRECSLDSQRLLMTCNKVRGHSIAHDRSIATMTCWQIWHDAFDCGNDIPDCIQHRVQFRRSRVAPGERKKTPRELNIERKRKHSGDGAGGEESAIEYED